MFYIIYSYQPISLDKSKQLSKLGLIVPYDSLNQDINTYAYLPKGSLNDTQLLKQIKTIIGDNEILPNTVTLEAINKSLNKIEIDNKLELGSIVHHTLFRTLPLTVTHIDREEETATVFHKLKQVNLSVELPIKELQKAEQDKQFQVLYPQQDNTETHTETSPQDKSITIIDCDIHTTKTVKKLAHTLILASLLIPETEFILANPDMQQTLLAREMQLSVLNGSILNLLATKKANIISNNLTYLIHQNTKSFYKYNNTLQSVQRTDENILLAILNIIKLKYIKHLNIQYELSKYKQKTYQNTYHPKVLQLIETESKREYTLTSNTSTIPINYNNISHIFKNNMSWHICNIVNNFTALIKGNK